MYLDIQNNIVDNILEIDIGNINKDNKFEVGDHVRTSKHKQKVAKKLHSILAIKNFLISTTKKLLQRFTRNNCKTQIRIEDRKCKKEKAYNIFLIWNFNS